MLTKDEQTAVREIVADYSVRIVDAATMYSKEEVFAEMNRLYNFICEGLVIARRDGIKMALRTTTN
jgi:hypothetical protein